MFSRSLMSDSVTPWTAARQASLSFTISPSLLRLMSTETMIPSTHLILCHPLLLLSSIFPSISVFSSESVLCIRWPKYGCFSISPCNEYSGLISFRIDWFDLLVSKGLSRVFSSTTFQKHQFFGARSSLWSNPHIHLGFMVQVCWVLYGPVLTSPGASLMAQMVRKPPVMQETWVQPLSREDSLEKQRATYSCILA